MQKCVNSKIFALDIEIVTHKTKKCLHCYNESLAMQSLYISWKIAKLTCLMYQLKLTYQVST